MKPMIMQGRQQRSSKIFVESPLFQFLSLLCTYRTTAGCVSKIYYIIALLFIQRDLIPVSSVI